ncbi:MAG: IS1595 family transposase [Candidatus Babeliaceae bacterium]|jgi:transposase-like protein
MTSAFEIANKYNTKKKCVEYLIKTRWSKSKAICPFCGSKNTANLGSELGRFHCNACKTHFSVTVGTIFHDTRLELPKWFMLISLMVNSKQGKASKELERQLGITYKTAWLSAMRVRCAMIESQRSLQEVVEMDEAYVGGKPKKRYPANRPTVAASNIDTNPIKRGRGTNKIPVIAIVERKGQVVLKVAERLTSKVLINMLRENVKLQPSTKVMTDDYRGYMKFDDIVKHYSVNHSKGEYVRGSVHTNTIEGFFSILKRSIKGNYIAISKKYLPMYLAQAQFTYNHRNMTKNLFDYFMKNALTHEKCMMNYKPLEEPKNIAYIPRKKKISKINHLR